MSAPAAIIIDDNDYTIVPNLDYVASKYVAPPVFKFVGSILERIVVGKENSGDSGGDTHNSILAFVSGNRSEQVEYIQGLVGIGIFLCCLVLIWFLAILLLKCQGRDRMGCSAGYAFHDVYTDTDTDNKEGTTRNNNNNNNNNTPKSGYGRQHEDDDDDSIGAAVDDDDSIAMDEPEKRESRRLSRLKSGSNSNSNSNSNSSNNRMSLSMKKLSSVSMTMFGSNNKTKTQQEERQVDAEAIAAANKEKSRQFAASSVRRWSVTNKNDNHSFKDGTPLEEFELHMIELDDIVHQNLSASPNNANNNKSGRGRRSSGRSGGRGRNADKPITALYSIPKKSKTVKTIPKRVRIGDEDPFDDDDDDSSTPSTNKSRRSKIKNKVWGQTICCSFESKYVSRRKFSTRIAFGFFAITSLVCCVLLMTHMYIPLENAALTSQDVIEETSNIVNEINNVLAVLDEVTKTTVSIMNTIPLSYSEICPSFSLNNFITQFGFNPEEMISTISKEYINYIPTIINLLKTAKDTSTTVTSVLEDVNLAVSTTNEYLWIIPLIICTTILIIFSQLALLCAVIYGERSSTTTSSNNSKGGTHGTTSVPPKIENCYGYTVLPLQTIIVLISWLLVILFCFGIIITTDSCTPSINTANMPTTAAAATSFSNATATSTTRDKIDIAFESITSGRGTPDDTVLAVLDQYMAIGSIPSSGDGLIDDIAKQRITTYITGCGSNNNNNNNNDIEDPLAEIIIIQGLLQESLDYVDTHTSFAYDVLGLDLIEEMCGGGTNDDDDGGTAGDDGQQQQKVQLFFDNIQLLNKQFVNVNKVIKLAYDALSCPRINTLYVDVVHNALCTDFATANTNGLLLLIIISFCGMVLITLRSSWRTSST